GERGDFGRAQPGHLDLLGDLVVLGPPAEEVQGDDQVAAEAGDRGQRLLDAPMVAFEGRAAPALAHLGLGAARRMLVGVGRAEELLDEVLAAAPGGEGPLAQPGTDHPEVLEDGVAVDDVARLHGTSSPAGASAARWRS